MTILLYLCVKTFYTNRCKFSKFYKYHIVTRKVDKAVHYESTEIVYSYQRFIEVYCVNSIQSPFNLR